MYTLSKTYEPASVDPKWNQISLDSGFFSPKMPSAKPGFSVLIPPPNVTGVLHMGHALVDTLQDVYIRWKRMCGHSSLWLPGVDHAGISTQTVVDKHLIATTGKGRCDMDRETFLEHTYQWKEEKEKLIIEQIQRLGCSCDWTRYRFTMDETCSTVVKKVFKQLFDEGLIYRGQRLVNWDPVTQTALADDEVEYEEQPGFLWHIAYPLADGSSEIVIATTRPETLLADAAVAVHPEDPRYLHLHGKEVIIPIANRRIPIIADSYVEKEFGTGALKITPAHDPNDYLIGAKHNLEMINLLLPNGSLNDNALHFKGMTMEQARSAIVAQLKIEGFMRKEEPHIKRVGISYRSKAVIEPFLSLQWFVAMSGFKEHLRQTVETDEVSLYPSSWKNTYFYWIDNLRDWCISRQLWWGHRIPVWYHKEDSSRMICHDGEEIPPEVAAAPDMWIQDEDVLDTWFSSALWPLSTTNWLEGDQVYQTFYPTSLLVTGHDILFFWVARMMFMCHKVTGQFPFKDVLLTGLIYGKSYWRQDPQKGVSYLAPEERLDYELGRKPVPADVQSRWEKMSKSKGNVIDPLELIDEYGTDAVRMTLCASAPQSRQIDLDRRKFEEFRNFTNKVWNGARFILTTLFASEQGEPFTGERLAQGINRSLLAVEDRWILSRLNRVIEQVNTHLESYTVEKATMAAYEFYWKELCDYYLEMSKPVLFGKQGSAAERENKQRILFIILTLSARLLHPMAPFITEELFSLLKSSLGNQISTLLAKSQDPYAKECLTALNAPLCVVTSYPQKPIVAADISLEHEEQFAFLEQLLYHVRNLRGELRLPPGEQIQLYAISSIESDRMNLEKCSQLLSYLAKVSQLNILSSDTQLQLGMTTTRQMGTISLLLPVPSKYLEQERTRLSKQLEGLTSSIEKTKAQLNNPSFTSRAPKELVEKLQQQLSQMENEFSGIQGHLGRL
jgi:valyl-tRNA synthetase